MFVGYVICDQCNVCVSYNKFQAVHLRHYYLPLFTLTFHPLMDVSPLNVKTLAVVILSVATLVGT